MALDRCRERKSFCARAAKDKANADDTRHAVNVAGRAGTPAPTKPPNAGRTDAGKGRFPLSPLAIRAMVKVLCGRMWLLLARGVLGDLRDGVLVWNGHRCGLWGLAAAVVSEVTRQGCGRC